MNHDLENTQDDDFVFEGTLTGKKSKKAFEVQGDLMDDPEWIPYSQCSVEELAEDGKVRVHVRKWLARKNGWV